MLRLVLLRPVAGRLDYTGSSRGLLHDKGIVATSELSDNLCRVPCSRVVAVCGSMKGECMLLQTTQEHGANLRGHATGLSFVTDVITSLRQGRCSQETGRQTA